MHSLERALQGIDSEVIVVDNASADGSVDMLRNQFPWVHVIESSVNLGFSKANNLGIQIARGEFIVLLNPDTIVQEDTFRGMLEFFEKTPDAGMAGCKVLNPDGSLQLACRRSFPSPWVSFTKISGLSTLFPKSKLFARYNLTYLDENATYEVDAISGSFMMIRHSLVKQIGGLDERFFMYGEDLDWCYRVKESGLKVYYVHSTQIIHFKGESTKRSTINETKVFYEAMHLFVKKHFTSSAWALSLIRLAIVLRQWIASLAKVKLVFAAVLLDTLFFNTAIFLAEKTYSYYREYDFPESFLPVIYSVPVLIHLFSGAALQVYRKDSFSILRSLGAVVVSFFAINSLLFYFKDVAFSRIIVVFLFMYAALFLSMWRFIAKFFFRWGAAETMFRRNKTLIVGNGEHAVQLAKRLDKKHTDLREVVGLIALSMKDVGETVAGYKVIGSVETISKAISDNKINEIVFSSDEVSYAAMMGVVAACQDEAIDFKITGNKQDFIIGKSSISMLDDIPLFEVTLNIKKPIHRIIKRLSDLAMSTVLLPMLPYFILRGSKLKYVGKVFTGSMSIVGPIDGKTHNGIYCGKPGLTGIWYYEEDYKENREKLDIFYAKNQNIWFDLEIIGRSLNTFLMKRMKHGENGS